MISEEGGHDSFRGLEETIAEQGTLMVGFERCEGLHQDGESDSMSKEGMEQNQSPR